MKRWLLILMGVLCVSFVAHAGEFGKTTVLLDGSKISTEETALGIFVADAVRITGGADVAILHAMAFRSNAMIPAGAAVDEQVIRSSIAMPSSKIYTLKMSPALLRNVIEHSLSKYPNGNLAFLQYSGMMVTFNAANPPKGRVQSITIGTTKLELADTKTLYTVAMPRELAVGAVGYIQFFNDDVMKSVQVLEITLLDAIAREFERQKGEISPKVDDRLKDTNKST